MKTEINKLKLSKFEKFYNGGLHWLFENNGHTLSIICHEGSYGYKAGLFEIMASWEEDVVGYLTFGDVQKWIDILTKKSVSIKPALKRFLK